MTELALAFAIMLMQTQPTLTKTDDNDFAISYPVLMTTSDYVWRLQSTISLPPSWVDEPLETDGTNIVLHKNGRNNLLFRIVGTPK